MSYTFRLAKTAVDSGRHENGSNDVVWFYDASTSGQRYTDWVTLLKLKKKKKKKKNKTIK